MEWELVYDADGASGPDAGAVLDAIASSGVRDLFVFSHGWNTDRAGARDLYSAMSGLLRDAVGDPVRREQTGFLGVFWPSVWFPDTAATVPDAAGAPQAVAAQRARSGSEALTGAEIAGAMRDGFAAGDRDAIDELGRLIDDGLAAAATGAPEAEQQRRVDRFHDVLGSLVPRAPGTGPEDAGELPLLFSDRPARDYRSLAATFGTAQASVQGIGDVFGAAFQGAKEALRVLSFATMKTRAGTVGRDGLGPHLRALHEKDPALRVHLLGHSFGARLVSYALSGTGTPEQSPVASLLLIQGAFSHFTFAHAQDSPFGRPGALHEFGDRVHGARVATFSVHDFAVGVWYPKASVLSGSSTDAVTADRWGAMGADGYQAVTPVAERVLGPDGVVPGGIPADGYVRVDANAVIADEKQSAFAGAHSDIRHPAVARLALAVAAITG